MKKLLIFNLLFLIFYGCGNYNPKYSKYQNKCINKFCYDRKLNENVPNRKNGSYRHPAVAKETYKKF